MAHSKNVGESFIFSTKELAKKVHSSFSSKYQKEISIDKVHEVVSSQNLLLDKDVGITPRLLIRRLEISGQKSFADGSMEPSFTYGQDFSSGVNVLLIPDNNVGKSSVMKTIKFALTGDDSGYDADVKSWIRYIRLYFSVGKEPFTIHIIRQEESTRAVLVAREELTDITTHQNIRNVYFDVSGLDVVKERLQQFFFDRFKLDSLSWTQNLEQRDTSWRTFFQALLIPDSSDQYLICDPKHAMGNQDGLILSTFLGLRLVKALNILGVESSLLRKRTKLTKAEIDKAKESVTALSAELNHVKKEISIVEKRRAIKFQSLKSDSPSKRSSVVVNELIQAQEEEAYLKKSIEDLSHQIKSCNSKARGLKESIVFKKHFTGLNVSLCPNCDTEVEAEAIAKEHDYHTCRLCDKPASLVSEDEIERISLRALNFENTASKHEKTRDKLRCNRQGLLKKCEALQAEQDDLKKLIDGRIDSVLTEAQKEDSKLPELYARVGHLEGQLKEYSSRAQSEEVEEGDTGEQLRIVEKARGILKDEAAILNKSKLSRLSHSVQDTAKVIGIDSIHSVECKPLGRIKLSKYDQEVAFKSIQNPGERLRVKLAFFLSMMRIGREPGIGRHPGFLMIDQLGANEMVVEDCEALSKILNDLDKDLAKTVQLICFTAKSEFANATHHSKVYGPQSGNKAF